MGSYLGLPESLGGSKSKIFAFVQERLQDRINGWSAKFLSKGGREILIKSVASALPTYVMSCFRLPKAVTTKHSSAIARFWWSSGGDKKGIHWYAWQKLSKPKVEGGIGFRTINEFNSALLAKQLWRLINYPDSLLARVLKGRYYKTSNPMAELRYYSPSYGWRSIMSSKFILEQGLLKQVGYGNSISVWKDNWILDVWPRPARARIQNYPQHLKVNHLIDPRTKTWNTNTIAEFFDPYDIPFIRAIPISKFGGEDRIIWALNKTGKYTVKSGYWVAQNGKNRPSEQVFYGPNVNLLLSQSWKINAPSKLKHFLWQVISGCLPVNQRLKHRGIDCDTLCSRCGQTDETINHALFECPPALQTWALSDIPSAPNIFPSRSVWGNMDYLFWRIPDKEKSDTELILFPWIIWFIWKARNDKTYQGINRDPPGIVKYAKSEALAWWEVQKKHDHVQDKVEHIPTLPIRTQKLCQIDGSWKQDSTFSGLGWWCANIDGTTFLLGAKGQRRSLSSLNTELEALLWAMECLLGCQEFSISFQSDSMELVKMTTDPSSWPAFTTQLKDFDSLKNCFSEFSLEFCSRTKNLKADNLARSSRLQSYDFTYVNSVPPVWLNRPFV